MTQAEFYAAQRKARKAYLDIIAGKNRKIYKLYIDAADQVARKIKTLKLKGKGKSLTSASLKALEKILRETGENIGGGVSGAIVDGINRNALATNKHHVDFIKDAIKLSENEYITGSVIQEMYAGINRRLIDLTYSRIWRDGYDFSSRVWGGASKIEEGKSIIGLYGNWRKDVKNIVNSGIAQNRDVLQIAKDLSVYARKGKRGIMKRYGDLVSGTSRYVKRIPKHIDWRALRLARTELYVSIRESARMQGHNNPAIQWYIWNMTTGGVHDCECPDIEAGSPYLESEIPDTPHPSCMCYVTHKIKARDEFVRDLKDWGNGLTAPYLDDWYKNVYLPFKR